MTPQQERVLAEIKTAWESPIVAGWNPNVAPVLRVSIPEPCRVITTMEANAEADPNAKLSTFKPQIRFVEFRVEFGRVDGVKVYRVVATLDGMKFQITTGTCA